MTVGTIETWWNPITKNAEHICSSFVCFKLSLGVCVCVTGHRHAYIHEHNTWIRTIGIVEKLNAHAEQQVWLVSWWTLHPSSFLHPFSRVTIRTDQPWLRVLQGYRRVVGLDLLDLLMSTHPAPRWWWYPSSSSLLLAPLRATSSPQDRLVHISNDRFVKMTCIYYWSFQQPAHMILSICSSY